jgi:hypothetical protein
MLELHEREEQAAPDNRAAAEKAAQSQRLQEAGLAGVESMLEDLVAAEPEWAKLAGIPGLLDPWHDVREKTGVVADEFKVCVCVGGRGVCWGVGGQLLGPGVAQFEEEEACWAPSAGARCCARLVAVGRIR